MTMKINLKLFGPFSLIAGKRQIEMRFQKQRVSVREFLLKLNMKPRLFREYGDIELSDKLEGLLRYKIMFFINEKQCYDIEEWIYDGDHVKILAQITGG